jgi:hypothetical protein
MNILLGDSTADQSRTERRMSRRYPLSGMAWFQWQAEDGRWHEGNGFTRDIGKTGAFIETDSLPSMPTGLNLVITVATGLTAAGRVCLCGSGHVRHLRQQPGDASGFGASVTLHVQSPTQTA